MDLDFSFVTHMPRRFQCKIQSHCITLLITWSWKILNVIDRDFSHYQTWKIIISAPRLRNAPSPEIQLQQTSCSKTITDNEEKWRQRCAISILDSKEVNARKSSTPKCRQSGKDHESSFRGRGGRGGGLENKSEGGEWREKASRFFQREARKGKRPGKMCHRKGREWRRQEKLLCQKCRETTQLYLER